MVNDLYKKFDVVKKLFNQADDILNYSLTKLIIDGSKENLDQTENTQPAIFLVGYSIFQLAREEFSIDLNKAKFFAGHSLGEYTALAAAGSLGFADTLKLLRVRGKAMQEAVPRGQGGMIAVLGSNIEFIEKIILDNKNNYECFIANDNSNGQLVISGTIKDLDLLIVDLKKNNIKNIKLPVSAPFHCKLMSNATKIMNSEIEKCDFKKPNNTLISNVTSEEVKDSFLLKELLIKQIESRVRWRESVNYMIKNKINKFIEIGPGKVLSGLIKRIDKNVTTSSVNNEEDINKININD
jgi:[acyl-carrier-protein] S-malonyltransferase